METLISLTSLTRYCLYFLRSASSSQNRIPAALPETVDLTRAIGNPERSSINPQPTANSKDAMLLGKQIPLFPIDTFAIASDTYPGCEVDSVSVEFVNLSDPNRLEFVECADR